ncbi:unnamed protein product [Somion occarium]|uniref:Uncharacterized protein n=1 Tax=Somion occarium TaxID=3059160 RepID=A0ABP1E9J1_9APHY
MDGSLADEPTCAYSVASSERTAQAKGSERRQALSFRPPSPPKNLRTFSDSSTNIPRCLFRPFCHLHPSRTCFINSPLSRSPCLLHSLSLRHHLVVCLLSAGLETSAPPALPDYTPDYYVFY